MNWLLELLVSLAAVDFVSGLVHWAEDTFGTEATPVLGRWIVAPNVRHHLAPTAFVAKGWWASNWDLSLAAVVLAGAAFASGHCGPGVCLVACVGAQANQIHKWCHAPRRAPFLVRALWASRLLQRPAQHARHHRGEKNEAYCVVTPFLNPVLDALRFWRCLEFITVPFTGAPRRADLRSLPLMPWVSAARDRESPPKR